MAMMLSIASCSSDSDSSPEVASDNLTVSSNDGICTATYCERQSLIVNSSDRPKTVTLKHVFENGDSHHNNMTSVTTTTDVGANDDANDFYLTDPSNNVLETQIISVQFAD